MKFSNTIKTVLRIYQKYVKNSVWFGTGKLPFLHKKEAERSFELSLSIFLSFNSVFLTFKCRTLLLKHLHGNRVAAILLKMDIRH